MDQTIAATDLSAASWEAWIGAVQRLHHAQALLATARSPKPRAAAARKKPRTRGSFFWMLAVSVGAFLLL